jgi:eukaryotic translation initiation factor 2C
LGLEEQNKLPNQIIFYRDGVSEGEFGKVATLELPQIQKAITQVYAAEKTSKPKLLLICVVKRSAARFFPKNFGDRDKNGNLFPGVVIDREVTYERAYDWFMHSHFSLQGTPKPAYYVVLHDEICAPPDVVQRATYCQCFTYGRSLRSISVHPAARLADRTCNRARAYLRKYLLAGEEWDNVFDQTTNAKDAWNSDADIKLKDSMFYV